MDIEKNSMVKCKHGMEKAWCALCNPKEDKRSRRYSTIHGTRGTVMQDFSINGHETINTVQAGAREKIDWSRITVETRLVHIQGCPYLWVIKKILEEAPYLETIQVIPTYYRKIRATTHELALEKGVTIRMGHWRPEMAWQDFRNINPAYDSQRTFLVNLEGEQKRLWAELLEYNMFCARITSRYFCLNHEPFVPQVEIIKEFSLPSYTAEAEISKNIAVVFRYLDPEFDCGEGALGGVRRVKQRVAKLRELLEIAAGEEALKTKIIAMTSRPFPQDLPLRFFDVYQALVICDVGGKLAILQATPGREAALGYQVIRLRYGFDDNKFHTFGEISTKTGVTKQRNDQAEKSAFITLGIADMLPDD